MSPQAIVVQAGQCGNQLGTAFWDLLLKEHAQQNPYGLYEPSMATFFRDSKPVSGVSRKMTQIRARGVMVDTEERVLNNFSCSRYAELFSSPHQRLFDVSGSGNNWAVGNRHYGPLFRDRLENSLRLEAEATDNLQAIFLLHSWAGGTGSGLGAYIGELMGNIYPKVNRFACSVIPGGRMSDNLAKSDGDDVVTAPYNAILAYSSLLESKIDGIFAFCNADVSRFEQNSSAYAHKTDGYNTINSIIARVLSDITSSVRFSGPLNVDINELAVNLVPMPSIPIISSSISHKNQRNFDEMFRECVHEKNFLTPMNYQARPPIYAACSILARGNVAVASINKNIMKIQNDVKFTWWNKCGWKTGISASRPCGESPVSLLCLANSSSCSTALCNIREKFLKLYSRKANLHHYTAHLDSGEFDNALQNLNGTIQSYAELSFTRPVGILCWQEWINKKLEAQTS